MQCKLLAPKTLERGPSASPSTNQSYRSAGSSAKRGQWERAGWRRNVEAIMGTKRICWTGHLHDPWKLVYLANRLRFQSLWSTECDTAVILSTWLRVPSPLGWRKVDISGVESRSQKYTYSRVKPKVQEHDWRREWWQNREERWRTLSGIRSCNAHTTGIVRWMSNAIVSFPAFFEVELLSRRYLRVCEVVDKVGRINPFVYAESEFRSP